MLLSVAGREVPVRHRYAAPLPHGRDQLHLDQFVLTPDSAKADRSNVTSNIASMYQSKSLAPKPARLRVTCIQHFINSDIADELFCLTAGITTLRGYARTRLLS